MAMTTTQVAAEMIETIASATNDVSNFNIGSVIRSIVDAVAVNIAQIDANNESEVSLGIVNAPFQLLDATPAGATGSTYLLAFSLAGTATAAVTIAEGAAITIPNSAFQWEVGQSFTIEPGDTVNVTATCTTVGAVTNVPANTITQLVNPQNGVTVTNPSAQPVVLGRDEETEQELQAALANRINFLHRADKGSVEDGALKSELTDAAGNPIEQVISAVAMDYAPGEAFCYVYNGIGPMSSALLTQTQNIMNGYTDAAGIVHVGYKAAGVYVTVQDSVETAVNVSLAILPQTSVAFSSVQENVYVAVETFFETLDIQSTFSLTQLTYAVMTASGLEDMTLLAPTASLPSTPYIVPPSVAPTLTASSPIVATDLAAGTYTVAYTWTDSWGETTASPVSSIAIAAGQAIDVGSMTLANGALGINYYMSNAEGSTTLALVQSGTGGAITLESLPTVTTAPPTTNTAVIENNVYVMGTVTITLLTP